MRSSTIDLVSQMIFGRARPHRLGRSPFQMQAPKGASGFEDFVVSLKRYPDTKPPAGKDERVGTVSNDAKAGYNRFLLLVAGLGGLLYGVDVGIIAGAYPYLEATSTLNAGQLSSVVAAVLLGSVISTLFAGALADWMGRKPLMILSGLLFVCSIPVIALSHGYESLVLGRLLQGISAGLIGVVVPLYLAECLAAATRGKGTGIFQWLLTLGIVTAAFVGMYFSFRVEEVAKLGDPTRLFAFKDTAWRSI